MPKDIPKTYNPKETEDKIYALWEEGGYFNPDKLPSRHKKPYTITLPPPNVTGSLHMGHALQVLIHDAVIRHKRMQGYKTLWLPGTDHAGIATQNKVEKELKKEEGLTRHDLGREKFEKKVWEWKEKYGNIILGQLKREGASCDWSRTRFTMDEDYTEAVLKAFVHYYEKGLIYRDIRVINWCPRCATSISDLEVNSHVEKGSLWYINYPIKDSNKHITVATTRPETMLGDAAIAVHPKDARYKDLIGKTAILPLRNKEIPIIADQAIDPDFGTGAVKVTPMHDALDWEISQRHKLQGELIIDERRKMSGPAAEFCDSLNAKDCQKRVIEQLKEKNLIEKEEEIEHGVPYCDRCDTRIEPLASLQWFLKMDSLAEHTLKAVKKNTVKFIPKKWEKLHNDWFIQKRDWAISRQLWWGHRLPVWQCKCQTGKSSKLHQAQKENFIVSVKKPRKKCEECKAEYQQIPDVLDTWFSSALWPFAALGWPKQTKDFKTHFPTDLLVTARDIINLWVGRMVFSSYEFLKKPPFPKVLIHPTVLTRDGKRMSKSLGTGIDPLELIDQYGADATRFGLAYQIMEGQDIHFAQDHIVMGKKLCNKLWNATRFIMLQYEDTNSKISVPQAKPRAHTSADKKILNELDKLIPLLEKDIDSYQFGRGARKMYRFFWNVFADIYIEKSKEQINNAKTKKEKEQTLKVLLYTHATILKLMHPFIPFITEELYQALPIKNKTQLMVERWPKA